MQMAYFLRMNDDTSTSQSWGCRAALSDLLGWFLGSSVGSVTMTDEGLVLYIM